MQWFKSSELDKLIQLIDDAKVTPIGKWFWQDFRNNLGTLIMGYIYAIKNKAPKKIRKKLRDLIHPKGKPSSLVYKDAVSEVYKEYGENDLLLLVNALIDDEVQFEIKDAEVADLLLHDSKFEKAREFYYSDHPYSNIISKYMKGDEKAKLAKTLFDSDNYKDIVQAMQSEKKFAYHYAYMKTKQNNYTRAAKKIKNKKLRRRYLLEYVYVENAATFEDLYDTIAEHFEDGVLFAEDVVEILTRLNGSANGNGRSNRLINNLVKAGKIKELREIIKKHKPGTYKITENFLIFRTLYSAAGAAKMGETLEVEFIFYVPDMIDDKLYAEELITIFAYNKTPEFKNRFLETFPMVFQNDLDTVVQLFNKFDDDFKLFLIENFFELLDRVDPEDLPELARDLFMI